MEERDTTPLPCDVEMLREQFKETVQILALRIPQAKIGSMLKHLHGHLVSRRGVKVVIPDEDNEKKKLLLSEAITDPDLQQLPSEVRDYIFNNQAEITTHTLQLGYEHHTADQILRRILPPELPVCSAFETIGHIAHLNLREGHLPYRRIIGQVILDKNPRIRTVVNKMQSISTVFRTFNMEIIAGEENLNTEVHESKCRFKFNYGEVYWNSRLQHEHDRLVGLFKKDDVICDMFAGVGPFAVPAARNVGCEVYANDLNPKSYKALCENVELNKVKRIVHCFNMDARDFARKLIHEACIPMTQVVMNLPASAELFLDAFKGFPSSRKPPTIHCYVFTSAENATEDVIQRIEAVLDCSLRGNPVSIHEVRDVAPKKRMMCVSFPLPTTTTCSMDEDDARGIKRKTREVAVKTTDSDEKGEKKEKEKKEKKMREDS